jgi:hypothetical protein
MRAVLVLLLALPVLAGASLLDRSPLDAILPASAFPADTLVCVGDAAPQAEKDAAARIAAALRAAGGPADNLRSADALNRDPLAAGRHHLIAVGTWADNVVLRKCWGHWAMTAPQRETYRREEEATRAAFPPDKLTPIEAPWRWTGDLTVFATGQYTGSVGYLEPVRNFYALQLVANGLGPKPEEIAKTDQRFVLKVSGTDADGVARAAKAFLERGQLYGVLPAEDVAVPADWSPGALGRPQLTAPLPAWAPAADVPGEAPLRCLGWLQGTGLHYAGFREATGVAPRRLWRVKFAGSAGFKAYDDFLTPRASGHEVLIVETADPAAARAAVQGFSTALGGTWQPHTVNGWNGARSADGVTVLASGSYVLAESLPPGPDLALLAILKTPEVAR